MGVATVGFTTVALLFVLTASGASAQALPIELGVGVSRTGNPVAALSDDGCAADNAWAGEARGGLRLSRAVRVEATAGYHLESRVRCAALRAPPPAVGPFTETEVTVPDAGYPYFTTDARLAFEPSTPSGPLWLRAFGGYGLIWGKNIGYWLAGGGLVFGGNLQTMIDLEWNWFDVPFDEITRTFQDGVLTSEMSSPGKSSHRVFRIKLAFRWPL